MVLVRRYVCLATVSILHQTVRETYKKNYFYI